MPLILGFAGWRADGHLRGGGGGDAQAQRGQVAGLVGRDLEAELVRIDEREEGAAVSHVGGDGADALDLERGVEPDDEGRHAF